MSNTNQDWEIDPWGCGGCLISILSFIAYLVILFVSGFSGPLFWLIFGIIFGAIGIYRTQGQSIGCWGTTGLLLSLLTFIVSIFESITNGFLIPVILIVVSFASGIFGIIRSTRTFPEIDSETKSDTINAKKSTFVDAQKKNNTDNKPIDSQINQDKSQKIPSVSPDNSSNKIKNNQTSKSLETTNSLTVSNKPTSSSSVVAQHGKEIIITFSKVEIDDNKNISLDENKKIIKRKVTHIENEIFSIKIEPFFTVIRAGELQQYTIKGFDRYRITVPVELVKWRASGGSIDDNGILKVDTNSIGIYEVSATINFLSEEQKFLRTTFFTAGVAFKLLAWTISKHDLFEGLSESDLEVDVKDKNNLEFLLEDWASNLAYKYLAKMLSKVSSICFFISDYFGISDSALYLAIPAVQKETLSFSNERDTTLHPSQRDTTSHSSAPGNISSPLKAVPKSILNKNSETASNSVDYSADYNDNNFDIEASINDWRSNESNFNENSNFLNESALHNSNELIYYERPSAKLSLDKSWFYKSQLFYDGYSEDDYFTYENYLDYVDQKDYFHYWEDF